MVRYAKSEAMVARLLEKAGIALNGSQAYDMQIHNPEVFQRILSEGNLGLGESYMDAWWDCQALDQFFERVLRAQLEKELFTLGNLKTLAWANFQTRILNRQSLKRAWQVNEVHYDLGNDLFQAMLDPRMVYTCAYWRQTDDLAQAQENKLELVCQKMQLQPGMLVLDIGCGWGSFMKYAAEKYGVTCIGYTLSREQMVLGQELCRGLPITFVLADYREIRGQFDRVVSIGMFEAVGYKNYRHFMQVVARSLKQNGAALLHTMGVNRSYHANDPWYDKYIFPNGMVPSLKQLGQAMEGHLILEDLHNIGPHYDPTLMAWNANFQAAWPELATNYSPRFKRMWEYYLLQVAGAYRARMQQLWQLVLAKPGAKQIACRDIRL